MGGGSCNERANGGGEVKVLISRGDACGGGGACRWEAKQGEGKGGRTLLCGSPDGVDERQGVGVAPLLVQGERGTHIGVQGSPGPLLMQTAYEVVCVSSIRPRISPTGAA